MSDMAYLRLAQTSLYYETHGSGTPVMLLHGAGQDTRSWRHVAPSVAEYARAVLIDLPAHGKSDVPPGGPVDDLSSYADTVGQVVDQLGLGRTLLVGHSMSAGIALMTALERPESVSAVVSVDGGGETNRTHGGRLLDLVAVNPADYFEENFRAICSPRTPPARVEEIAWDVRRCHPQVVYADIRAYAALSIDDRLGELDCPVRFIHGLDDWSIPVDIAEASAKQIRDSRVIPMPGTGHFPHVENPDAFNSLLRAAIEGW